MRVKRLCHLIAASTVLAGFPLAAEALQPHRAVYDLTLAPGTGGSAVSGISGRMVYEFSGSACEGYSVKFRYVTQFDTENNSQLIDEQSETFEAGDGSTFRFDTLSYIDDNLDRETVGAAAPREGGIAVEVEKPEPKSVELGEAMFPTQHLVDLIERAGRNETFYEEQIFDGSDGGEKIMTTTVVIGKPTEVAGDDPEREVVLAAGEERYWPVDMAYFDLSDAEAGGEEMPSYHISFKLHESGLTRSLTMDYGEFAIAGRLVDLEMFPLESGDCAE